MLYDDGAEKKGERGKVLVTLSRALSDELVGQPVPTPILNGFWRRVQPYPRLTRRFAFKVAMISKEAKKEYMRKWNAEHKEHRKAYNAAHKDHRNELRRQRYQTDAELRKKQTADAAEWRKNNPGRRRARELQQLYGITRQDYDRILAEQGGVCAICKGLPSARTFFYVDHDHATGKVRGILCMNCNHGIGRFKDDPARMRAAADYVERYCQAAEEQATLPTLFDYINAPYQEPA